VEGYLLMTSEEAAWIARAKAGDQAAFAAIFTRYERRIYSFIYRMMGDADDAYDLTQDTFLKAYRALGKTDDELNVNAWLHRIASNACMDLLRRRQRVRWLPWETAKHDRPSARAEDDPERTLLGGETQTAVQRVLSAMSPRNRQAMILREYEGLSCEDIGEVMGVSRSAVKSMLFRGREEFRKLYTTMEGQP
jgi:RNA polymerase sigma-70 factor, ECF subfamily